jgi:hypothetical protein
MGNILHEVDDKDILVVKSRAPKRNFVWKSKKAVFLDVLEGSKAILEDLDYWIEVCGKKMTLCGNGWDFPSIKNRIIRYATVKGLSIYGNNRHWKLY